MTVKGLTTPLSRWLQGSYLFVLVRGTWAWSPTGLIPWFSKTEGNTYATLLHHPFLFKGKPTHAQEVAMMSPDSAKWLVVGSQILTWLGANLPGNGARNPSCYLLSIALVFPEEEGMMQQTSVSIYLSFWEPRYLSSRRLRASPSYLHTQIRTSQPTR